MGDFTGAPRFFGIVKGPGLRPLSATLGGFGNSLASGWSFISKVFILSCRWSDAVQSISSLDHKCLMIICHQSRSRPLFASAACRISEPCLAYRSFVKQVFNKGNKTNYLSCISRNQTNSLSNIPFNNGNNNGKRHDKEYNPRSSQRNQRPE